MPTVKYFARVELHNANDKYEKLHELMEGAGFARSTDVKNQGTRALPDATYLKNVKEDEGADSRGKVLNEVLEILKSKDIECPPWEEKMPEKAKASSTIVGKLVLPLRVAGLKPAPKGLFQKLMQMSANAKEKPRG